MSDIDGTQVIDEYWPFDGPHDGDTVSEAAQAMARLGRYINNATRGSVLQSPRDLRVTVGSIATVLHQLPQLLDQVAARLERAAARTEFYDDHDSRDVDLGQTTTREAARRLRAALQPVSVAARAIDAAHAEVYRLGAR